MAKVIFLCLFLVGCNSFQERPDVIVSQCPAPPSITRPVLSVPNLVYGADAGTVLQSHRLDIKNLQSWGLQQEIILDGYRKEVK